MNLFISLAIPKFCSVDKVKKLIIFYLIENKFNFDTKSNKQIREFLSQTNE